MDDVERALSQIADIRARVSASSRFRGFAPQAMAFGSLLSLGVATAQTLWPAALASSAPRYLAVWGFAFVCASVVSAIAGVPRSRSLHGSMAEAMLSSTLRHLLPFAAACAVVAFVICRAAPTAAGVVPGLWQILVALAGFSLASSLPRAILLPTLWFFFTGAVALGLGMRSEVPSPWMMGLPFAIGQGMVALILARAGGGSDGRS